MKNFLFMYKALGWVPDFERKEKRIWKYWRTIEIIQWVKTLSTQTWKPKLNLWNPQKGGTREMTPSSCHLTSKHSEAPVPIHTHHVHAHNKRYIFFKHSKVGKIAQ